MLSNQPLISPSDLQGDTARGVGLVHGMLHGWPQSVCPLPGAQGGSLPGDGSVPGG